MNLKKILSLGSVLILAFLLKGATKLQFYTDVYAWYPDGQIKKISPGDGIYFQPCIHPEGTHVVYCGNSTGPPRVWKADLTSGEIVALTSSEANVRQVTKGPFQDERPCFSPDGKEITFVSNRLGKKNGLWRVSVDGSKGPWPLLRKGWGYRPWYSADGQWIFFYTGIDRRHRICKVPVNGGEVIPLANDNFKLSHGPFADPSGKVLLVHAIKEGEFYSIWEIPLNGDPVRQLMPPGFENAHHGHATRGKNGIITFDALRFQQTASTVEPPRTVDKSFSYTIKKPAYPEGKGPLVLIDEAHNNFHTTQGTYLPFAGLLRQDGYVIERAKEKISQDLPKRGVIYVIADAQPPSKVGDPPTFSREEIHILNEWVKKGGALFVITDHMPDPGAIKDLALSFGIEVSNGYVMQGPPPGRPGPTLFQKKNGSLADHFLTDGRGSDEHVDRVATFGGSAFRCDEGFQPLLILGEDFRSWMPKEYNKFPSGTPNVDVSGWFQGGVMSYGKGRIAFFAEAAMFTAQVFADGRVKAGMNHPLGRDNARLLLNILHWLSGITD